MLWQDAVAFASSRRPWKMWLSKCMETRIISNFRLWRKLQTLLNLKFWKWKEKGSEGSSNWKTGASADAWCGVRRMTTNVWIQPFSVSWWCRETSKLFQTLSLDWLLPPDGFSSNPTCHANRHMAKHVSENALATGPEGETRKTAATAQALFQAVDGKDYNICWANSCPDKNLLQQSFENSASHFLWWDDMHGGNSHSYLNFHLLMFRTEAS